MMRPTNYCSRFEAAICRNLQMHGRMWAPENSSADLGLGIREVLTAAFADYVEQLCDWPAIKASYDEPLTIRPSIDP